VRTLVVSDLHLGARGGADILRTDDARDALVDAIEAEDIGRVVLLGDVVELRQGPMRAALDTAAPVLGALGTALGSEREVVIVPGNHDHGLLTPWLVRRHLLEAPPPLGLEADVDWREDEPLARLAGCLGPARVRVAYPGVWVRDDVFALHGHYGDLHTTVPMFERIGAGLMERLVGTRSRTHDDDAAAARDLEAVEGELGVADELAEEAVEGSGEPDPRTAEDYEAVLGPMYAWIDALAQAGRSATPSTTAWRAIRGAGDGEGTSGGGLRRQALRLTVPLAIGALGRTGIGRLSADLSTAELRRAGLRAVGEAVTRLGVEANHVIFGHTHRAGPLPGEGSLEWRTRGGARLLNTGCWVHEPAFLGAEPGRSPYRAGFAALVTERGEPKLRNLLDPA
jgi:predicted phosphodiesterase